MCDGESESDSSSTDSVTAKFPYSALFVMGQF